MYILVSLCCFFLQNILIYVFPEYMSLNHENWTFFPVPNLPFFLLTHYGWDHSKAISMGMFLWARTTTRYTTTLQINSMNKANVSISLFLFLVLPVNRKITSNPITQTTSRQEQRQQFLFQPIGSTARSEDRFLSKRSMFSERQRLILGLKRKASEIITLVDVREQWEARDLGGSRSETWYCCQQEHSLGTNKENT